MTSAKGKDIDGAGARETGRTGKRARVLHRIGAIALVCLAVLPAVAAFVFLVALPAGRLTQQHQPKSKSAAERPGTEARDPAARQKNEEVSSLQRDEAFWNARLVLAKQEAIGLAVDLVDSVATLDIRGVPVRNCKIRSIEVSHAIRLLEDQSAWRSRLSRPLIVQNEEATIPKEPIRVTEAPKDTIEAMKLAARPVPSDSLDVFFTLYFDGNFALTVRQFEKPTSEGSKRHTLFRLEENTRQAKTAVMALVHSKAPQHQTRIEIAVSQEDAKAIYRALGPKAGLALRL
jgi:hypothetical protein